jgi:DNA topoisomerase-6 subunit B
VAQSIGRITGKSPDPIKREFLKLATKVTEAELAQQDSELEAQAKQQAKRPRRADEDEE